MDPERPLRGNSVGLHQVTVGKEARPTEDAGRAWGHGLGSQPDSGLKASATCNMLLRPGVAPLARAGLSTTTLSLERGMVPKDQCGPSLCLSGSAGACCQFISARALMVAEEVSRHLHAPLWVTWEGNSPRALQNQNQWPLLPQAGLAREDDVGAFVFNSSLHRIKTKLPI